MEHEDIGTTVPLIADGLTVGGIVLPSVGATDCVGNLLLGSALGAATCEPAIVGTPDSKGSEVGLDVGVAVSRGASVVGMFVCGGKVGASTPGVGSSVVGVGLAVGCSVSTPAGLGVGSNTGDRDSLAGALVGRLVELSVGVSDGPMVGLEVSVVGGNV